jgi:hypothetical protein
LFEASRHFILSQEVNRSYKLKRPADSKYSRPARSDSFTDLLEKSDYIFQVGLSVNDHFLRTGVTRPL